MDKRNEKICAGMVLYQPKPELLNQNIHVIINQVDKLFIFDNGSTNRIDINNVIKKYKEKIIYHYEKENKGIAYGLNWLLKAAYISEYDWCLTLDQDSICSSNMIAEYRKYLNLDNVALITPFILNNGKITLAEYKQMNLPDITVINEPMKAITSGCLTNVKIFKKLGGLNSKLFIDFVDTELNCKVINNGYKIIRVNDTYLIQEMGKGKKVPLFSWLYDTTGIDVFRRLKVVTVYPDFRLYYSARNGKYIRKHFKKHGKRTSFLFLLMCYCYLSLFYPADRSRLKMWKSIIKGYKDYKKL